MTTFPGSLRILKGALATFGLLNSTPTLILFQHNPAVVRSSPSVTDGEKT